MPEGPSIVILREAAAKFAGRKVRVSGNARQGIDRLPNDPAHFLTLQSRLRRRAASAAACRTRTYSARAFGA